MAHEDTGRQVDSDDEALADLDVADDADTIVGGRRSSDPQEGGE